jgi:hypothetical protein
VNDEEIAQGFRKCIVAAPGYVFIDPDFSAIEAVATGWLAQDPAYIKLAWAGVHDYMVGAELKAVPPVSTLHTYSVKALKDILKAFKKHPSRDRKKKTVHGVSYGQTAHGQAKLYPHLFSSMREAQKELDFFFSLCPSVPKLQKLCREMAHKKHYLGGDWMPGPTGKHPFGYKHWFWNVYAWDSRRQQLGPGQDYNRVVAFGGQSIGAGIIYNALAMLHDPEDPAYIGDFDKGHGRLQPRQWFVAEDYETPFRLQVHDSALFEVKESLAEKLQERIIEVMERPLKQMPCPEAWGLGEHLRVGIAIKVGRNWASFDGKTNPLGMREVYSTTL